MTRRQLITYLLLIVGVVSCTVIKVINSENVTVEAPAEVNVKSDTTILVK